MAARNTPKAVSPPTIVPPNIFTATPGSVAALVADGMVPPSIPKTFDSYRQVLGHTVPFNVNRATSAARRMRRVVS